MAATQTGNGKIFSFRLEGARDLDKALAELPKSMARSVLTRAAKKALQPVLEAARANAASVVGRKTGRYANSFYIGVTLTKRQRRAARKSGGLGDVNVYIGSSDRKAHLIEFGWEHDEAHPTLRPAWDANKAKVFQIFTEEIGKELMRAVRKQAIRGMKLTAAERRALIG